MTIPSLPHPHVLLLLLASILLLVLGLSITARERFSGTSLRLLAAILPVLASMIALAYLVQISMRPNTPQSAITLARMVAVGYYLASPALILLITSIFGQYRRHRLSLALFGLISLLFAAGALGGSLIVDGIRRFPFGFFPRLTLLGLSYYLICYLLFIVIVYRYWSSNPVSPRFIPRRRGWFFSLLLFAALSPADILIMAGVPIFPAGFIVITCFFIVAAGGIWRFRLDQITPSLAADEILAIMDDPLLVCDAQDKIRITNRAFSSAFGFASQEIIGRELDRILVCRKKIPVSRILDAAESGDIELRTATDEYVPVRISATPLSEGGGGSLGRVIILRDIRPFKKAEALLEERVRDRTRNLLETNAALEREIRERERAEADLRISRERYELIARATNDGIWDWDLESETVYYSPRWKEIVGVADEEQIGSPADWIDRIHPDDRPAVSAAIKAHIRGESATFTSEHRLIGAAGAFRWIQSRGIAARDRRGIAYRFAGSVSDITTRKEYEHQLLHDALHDALTGLPNRSAFIERLNAVFSKYRRDRRRRFSVLFMDLDRFKIINDSRGHQVGDQVLKQAARRLDACCRSADTVARIGGDEFVVLMEDVTDPDEVARAAERIRSEMSRAFVVESEELFSGVSIGIALAAPRYRDADEILRDADTAMYRAKETGKADTAD